MSLDGSMKVQIGKDFVVMLKVPTRCVDLEAGVMVGKNPEGRFLICTCCILL